MRYTFPLDGDYVFQAKLYRTNLNIVRGLEYPHQVEVAIDGKRVLSGDHRRAGRSRVAVRRADRHERRRGRPAARPRSRHRRSTRCVGGVRGRPAGGRADPAAAVSAQLDRQLRLGGAPAHPDVHDHRALQRHRFRRHAEPAKDFHVPAEECSGRSRLCASGFSRRWSAAPTVRLSTPSTCSG